MNNKNNNFVYLLIKNIFKRLHKETINDHDLKNKFNFFSENMNFFKLENTCDDIGIKLISKNKKDILKYDKKIFLAYIYIDYEKQYCLIKKNKNDLQIICKNKKHNLKYDQFLEIDAIKIWEYKKIKIKSSFILYKTNIESLKVSYIWISFILNMTLFILMILGNLYVKMLIQDILPNNAMYDLIFLSIFFLLIFILNTLVGSFLKIYKNKNLNIMTSKYFDFFLEDMMDKNQTFINNSKEDLLLNIKSIIPIIQKQIFAIPDFVSNMFILFTTLILMFTISYIFSIIAIISIVFHLIIFLFKASEVKRIGNKRISKETNIESQIHSYILKIKYEWNYKKFINSKNDIIESLIDFQCFSKTNMMNEEKINIIEEIGNKIIFILFSIISAFFIINSSYENFSLGLMVYSFTLINIINSNTEGIFNFISNISYYKMHENKLKEQLKFNVIKRDGILIQNKIKKICFNDFSLNFYDKNIFNKLNKIIKNDTIIFGRSGIGKTSILKSILPNNLSKEICLNGLSSDSYNLDSLKEKIIYHHSKNITKKINLNKLIYFDVNKTSIIIKFLKSNNLFNAIENDNSSLGEKQIINFLELIHLKNKILLLDEPLSHVDEKTKFDIIKIFKKNIIKENFVIWVSHDKKIKKYFKNVWELKNV